MSCLVGDLEDRFSRDAAHLIIVKLTANRQSSIPIPTVCEGQFVRQNQYTTVP